MEPLKKEEEKKHGELKEEGDAGATAAAEVALTESKHIKNIATNFLSQSKTWDDEENWKIPEDIHKNIVQGLNFAKPSIIQGVSIPLISTMKNDKFHSLIAQSKNGSGKTGSFTIGSVLRVDRKNPKTQVFCLTHTRELCNQVCDVYDKLCAGTGITVSNFAENDKNPGQIVVTTHGKGDKATTGRKPIDLSELKCFVIDEADVFFADDKNFETLMKIFNSKPVQAIAKTVQWVFFSATFPIGLEKEEDKVQERMSQICPEAQ